jgi:hypothetical protein
MELRHVGRVSSLVNAKSVQVAAGNCDRAAGLNGPSNGQIIGDRSGTACRQLARYVSSLWCLVLEAQITCVGRETHRKCEK